MARLRLLPEKGNRKIEVECKTKGSAARYPQSLLTLLDSQPKLTNP
jgi:hypothetical protein